MTQSVYVELTLAATEVDDAEKAYAAAKQRLAKARRRLRQARETEVQLRLETWLPETIQQ